MTNMQAALGLAQLERLDEFVRRKRAMGAMYTELLREIDGLQLPLPYTNYAENIYWVFGIVLEESVGFDAREAMRRLSVQGIGTRPFFWGMHEQPVLLKQGHFNAESYPVASNLARRGFYLPSGLALTQEQIERSASAMKDLMNC